MKIIKTLFRVVGFTLGTLFVGSGVRWLIKPISSGLLDILFNLTIIGLGITFVIWALSSRYHEK